MWGKKKKSGRKMKPFARRLTWRIMLTLLITMGVTMFTIFMLAWAVLSSEAEERWRNVLEAKQEYVRRVLADVHVATLNTVPEIELHLHNPRTLKVITERMARLNQHINTSSISRDPQLMALADTTRRGWWSDAFFLPSDTLTPHVNYYVPLHDRQDSLVAIFSVDISLEWLQDELRDVNHSNERERRREERRAERRRERKAEETDTTQIDRTFRVKCFIIDSTGNYVIHPDAQRIIRHNYFTEATLTPDTLDDHAGRLMLEGELGRYHLDEDGNELEFDGHSCYLFYAPIEPTGWSIALIVPSISVNIYGYVTGGLMVFFILIALIVTFFVSRRTIRHAAQPLVQLATTTEEVAKGNFSAPLPTLKHNDEIHLLRDSFEQMQHSLTQYVERLKTTTAEKASFESELKVAHNIQMSMLPKTFPPFPERDDVDIYGTLTPAKDVGGDLFDFFIRDEHLFFCIGDVSGKGVPASLVMAVTRSLFRNIAIHISNPSRIVMALNAALVEGNENNMFVTFFAGVLDLNTGHLHYSNAGHDAPLLLHRNGETGGTATFLEVDPNLPLGVMPDHNFSRQELDLDNDSMLFLFTDGLNEAEDSTHAQFGNQRIVTTAKSMMADALWRSDALVDRMARAVSTFVGDDEQSDDLTMLAIRYQQSAK